MCSVKNHRHREFFFNYSYIKFVFSFQLEKSLIKLLLFEPSIADRSTIGTKSKAQQSCSIKRAINELLFVRFLFLNHDVNTDKKKTNNLESN